ncbi:uncharacterized protein A4U43_C01F9620 [Asparagus officinalis]|uniref:Uncharacterized protein n=1 Tax=Asparagus officinalis TaxID=4686 RepID=A0A5P1FPU8_ASPOF|nr:uncharacterized protein A4U43_C01F9620 [Asparagus officinalis]
MLRKMLLFRASVSTSSESQRQDEFRSKARALQTKEGESIESGGPATIREDLWAPSAEVNSDAKAYQNKAIENRDDICVLVGTDRATGEGAEQIDDSIAAMDMEGDLRPHKTGLLELGRESYNKKYKAKVYKH